MLNAQELPFDSDSNQTQTSSSSLADPPLNRDFVWQGQISSRPTELREGDEIQSAPILPIREDEALYTGVLTFQSSRPVDVVVLNVLKPGNETAIPEQFGDLDDIVPVNGVLVSINEIQSGTSGSVRFTGNAIGLVADDDEPFLSSYSISGVPKEGRIVNDITNILNLTSTSIGGAQIEEEQEEEGEEEEEE